jgi:hypothetical protein
MVDEREHDEHDDEQPRPEAEPGEKRHHFKADLRQDVAKAWGLAVEAGSILAGQGGEIVQAERDVAEDEAEDLIDRIDGEG